MIRLLLALTLAGISSRAEEAEHLTDLPAGIAKAKAEGKHVFVMFTGSDWCIPCIKFEQNVMTHSTFKEFATSRLVAVILDIPYRKKIEPELKQRNEELAKKLGVNIYPTFLILDATGAEIGRRESYLGEPAAEFVKILRDLLKRGGEVSKGTQ
ncbi:MAG: thioredoxin family protein [Verrucomicrobiae bacterium]|nr:thioredoxin family protein [Verrucomicrobiae bacterium]